MNKVKYYQLSTRLFVMLSDIMVYVPTMYYQHCNSIGSEMMVMQLARLSRNVATTQEVGRGGSGSSSAANSLAVYTIATCPLYSTALTLSGTIPIPTRDASVSGVGAYTVLNNACNCTVSANWTLLI